MLQLIRSLQAQGILSTRKGDYIAMGAITVGGIAVGIGTGSVAFGVATVLVPWGVSYLIRNRGTSLRTATA